jgi:hypothetical protein
MSDVVSEIMMIGLAMMSAFSVSLLVLLARGKMLLRAEAAAQGNCFDAKSATLSNGRSTKSAAGLSTRLVEPLKLIHSFP